MLCQRFGCAAWIDFLKFSVPPNGRRQSEIHEQISASEISNAAGTDYSKTKQTTKIEMENHGL